MIVDAMMYDQVRDVMRRCFQEMNINACVYCNAQYLLTYSHVKKTMSSMQIDHYFDKSDWPCFSSSFFNFLPSCGYCNQKKSNRFVDFYLYAENDEESNPFKFEIPDSELATFLVDYSTKFSIKFKGALYNLDQAAKSHDSTFHIEDLYNDNFLEVVKNFIKRKMFLHGVVNSCSNSFEIDDSILKMSYNEIYFDFVDDVDKIHSAPLTKLKQDINSQINPNLPKI